MRDVPMKTLQAADKVLGWVACTLLQPLRLLRRRAGGVQRVLVIKFWGIGSLQLLTPAARTLRLRYPDARLELLTLCENEGFARGLGVFDEVSTLDVRGVSWMGIFGRILALVVRLRAERFDRVYDCEFFTRFSAVISLATGAPCTHGFTAPNVWRGGLHTDTVPFNRYWHVSRNFRALTGGEDGSEVTSDDIMSYQVTATDRATVARRLAEIGLSEGAELCILNPNAGRLSLERRWPAQNFGALADDLAGTGMAVVFIGSPGEVEYTSSVLALSRAARTQEADDRSAPVRSLAGCLSVGELCALFERATAVVSNDSGPMHIAAALGRPTLGLFGPETPIMYAPLGAQAHALWEPPVCSPCINVHDNKVATCIYGRPECLVNLTPERVRMDLRSLLDSAVLRPLPGSGGDPLDAQTTRTVPTSAQRRAE